MRLTNNMIMNNFMSNLRESMKKVDRLNNELSTGKKIIQASDDPVGALRSMQLQTIIKQNDQYIKNIGQAKDWIDAGDNALNELGTTLQRARELAIYGANESLDQTQRNSIQDEIIQLADHVVQIANTSIGNDFIFGGHKTSERPYDDYDPGTYQGDDQYMSVEISKNVKIAYSLPGDQVFDDAFNALRNMIDDLSPTGDPSQLGGQTLGDIDNAINTNLSARAELGSKMKRLELAQNRFEETNIKHTQLLSEIEDVDIAETIMNLRMQENVYRASLATGARIIQPTLIDFLN